ncbi:tyrosine-protein kinase receptor Tie-2, partial [Biomphalaria pfeifferi]
RSCTDVDQCLQCHCSTRCSKGLCLYNGQCDKGWFALGCQYNDLATIQGVSITAGQGRSSYFLEDNKDQTCDDYVADVTVSWNREYMLTWVRLVMKEI